MNLTATEAKNRLGSVLERAQREPVLIEKSGRRHGIVISVKHDHEYKDWVDMLNSLVEKFGIPGEEFRAR